MTARRFRAAPTASRGGMRIGVTMTPTGSGTQTPAQIAAERARQQAIEDAQCKYPATMRWRFYPDFTESFQSTAAPDLDPPEWPYDFLGYPSAEQILSPTEIVAGSDDPLYAEWTDEAIQINLGELGGAEVIGLFLIDFLDADGRPFDTRRNIANGCTDADGNASAVVWSVRFVQFEAGYGDRVIPFVHPDSDNRLIVSVRDIDTYVPGVLTITATDNFSPGGPFTFGPLVITYGSPPA